MRIYFILTAFLVISALTLPFIINKTSERLITDATNSSAYATDSADATSPENIKETVKVLRTSSGTAIETDMFDYITGAVAAEMPASFCIEALKAQAVACYTYAKYIKENTDNQNSLISDSSFVHQNYIDRSEQRKKWGDSYEEYRSVIEKAVKSVYGEYLSFEGETALTVFHALSYDKTNSAEEIWGEALPYLISVDAPSEGSSEIKCKFTAEDFKKLFEEKKKIKLGNAPQKWAKAEEKNDNGYIRRLSVGNETFTAIEIMELLSLPSTNFTAKYADGIFIFTVKGKGHGVGMSQYGAEYMALTGKSYKEILAHYYPGTALEKE